jgi:hypothetical protein
VDDQMKDVKKHPQAHLYPSELVTIGIPFYFKLVEGTYYSYAYKVFTKYEIYLIKLFLQGLEYRHH